MKYPYEDAIFNAKKDDNKLGFVHNNKLLELGRLEEFLNELLPLSEEGKVNVFLDNDLSTIKINFEGVPAKFEIYESDDYSHKVFIKFERLVYNMRLVGSYIKDISIEYLRTVNKTNSTG